MKFGGHTSLVSLTEFQQVVDVVLAERFLDNDDVALLLG